MITLEDVLDYIKEQAPDAWSIEQISEACGKEWKDFSDDDYYFDHPRETLNDVIKVEVLQDISTRYTWLELTEFIKQEEKIKLVLNEIKNR